MSVVARVIRSGLMTTVQDLGRPGTRHLGIPCGGAMDRLSHRLANRLVGNPDTAATLEMTLTGEVLQWFQDSVIAVTGADMAPEIQGPGEQREACPQGRPVSVTAGSVLKFGVARRGCRAYLSIAGGWDVPVVIGSRSTLLRSELGGFNGRALHAGDELRGGLHEVELARRSAEAATGWFVRLQDLPSAAGTQLRFVPGTHFGLLNVESQRLTEQAGFVVRSESDRMGYRLSGPPLCFREPCQIRSEAVVSGTLQLPPDGQLLMLMADCAPTGGYPRVGHIISADLSLAAQLKPGDRFTLRKVSQEMALDAAVLQERQFAAAVRLVMLPACGRCGDAEG
ncbi:MAG: biotin-dependent carboxyltransferase family protein [Planctomycetia bacterium]